jgi:hypothetical protein
MSSILRGAGAILVIVVAVLGATRIVRVRRGEALIPVYPGARGAGGRTRYLPHVLSWDDRSSARVQRLFALSASNDVGTVARTVNGRLTAEGWYLLSPEDLTLRNPQVIVWQRDPDERLDLMQVWPLPNMTREQRMYGGIFPAEFLDEPLVIEWSWMLGGARSPRPAPPAWPVVHAPPPPPPPASGPPTNSPIRP